MKMSRETILHQNIAKIESSICPNKYSPLILEILSESALVTQKLI